MGGLGMPGHVSVAENWTRDGEMHVQTGRIPSGAGFRRVDSTRTVRRIGQLCLPTGKRLDSGLLVVSVCLSS